MNGLSIVMLLCILVCCGCGDGGGVMYWKSDGGETVEFKPRPGDALLQDLQQTGDGVITSPQHGERLDERIIEVSGHITRRPPNARFYILLETRYGVHLQWPELVVGRDGRFTHRNVRFGTPGTYEMVLVAASSGAAAEFERHARANNWRHIQMPEGAVEVARVGVIVD